MIRKNFFGEAKVELNIFNFLVNFDFFDFLTHPGRVLGQPVMADQI